MRNLAVCLALLTVLLVGAQSFAAAQVPDNPVLNNHGGGAEPPPRPSSTGECPTSGRCFAGVLAGDTGGGPGSGDTPCEFAVGDFDQTLAELQTYFPDGTNPFAGPPPDPDSPVYEHPWVIIFCPHEIYGNGGLIVWDVVQLGDPPDAATMLRVAEQAVLLPVPDATFSPRAEHFQVVGLQTWIWLDDTQAQPVVRTACIEPLAYACVTVIATFVDVGAEMGDDSEVVLCDGTGTPYDFAAAYESQADLDHCSYVYTAAPSTGATYPVQVGTTWRVSYTCAYDSDLDGTYDSSCGAAFLGFVARLGAVQPLEVRDLQAVATQN